MITIRALLNRIRWDRDFGEGEFAIGYFDRREGRIIVVPLGAVHFAPDDHFSFELTDPSGQLHIIPLHRIYEVYRNGARIWQRPPPPAE